MSNVKKMTKEEVLEKKLADYKSTQYEILTAIASSPKFDNLGKFELYSKVSPLATKLVTLHNELGSNVRLTEKTPGVYSDFHGNSARTHLRTEGEKLVFSVIMTSEHGESKYLLIKAAEVGKVEITENMEVVKEIFEHTHIKDIANLPNNKLPEGLGIIESPGTQMSRDEILDLRQFVSRD